MTATATRKTAAAKKAAPAKQQPKPEPTPAVEAKPLTRAAAVALLRDKGYTGPVSFNMDTVRSILAWVEAGSPEGDGSIPAGAVHAVHPHLKPAPKAGGSNEARTIARDLRKAVTASLTAEGDDQAELLNEVDGLAARLRAALAS